jgi:hypothetical protein
MPEETLILKRNPNADQSEHYNVLFEGRYVGRIYKAVSHAPREAPWFCSRCRLNRGIVRVQAGGTQSEPAKARVNALAKFLRISKRPSPQSIR